MTAPHSTRSGASALLAGVALAALLVGGAIAAGRLPRQSPEYPGVVLDALPPGAWDGPTREVSDVGLGLTARIPADGTCVQNELELWVCHYPKLDVTVAYHVDAVLDGHDVGAELAAAKQRQAERNAKGHTGRIEERVVRLADTTGLLTAEGCAADGGDSCRNALGFAGFYGSGERRVRLWIEASFPKETKPELPLAILQSTRFSPPRWESLRVAGKSPPVRPELAAELSQDAASRDGRVKLRAPAGSTCRSEPDGVRCYGREGWYARVTLHDYPRSTGTHYLSVAEWTRRELERARLRNEPPPGELYALRSMVGFVTFDPCEKAPCRLRAVLSGYSPRDEQPENIRAEIIARSEDDLALGWAALDGAEISAVRGAPTTPAAPAPRAPAPR